MAETCRDLPGLRFRPPAPAPEAAALSFRQVRPRLRARRVLTRGHSPKTCLLLSTLRPLLPTAPSSPRLRCALPSVAGSVGRRGLRSLPCGSRLFPRTPSQRCGVCRGNTAPGRGLEGSAVCCSHGKSDHLAFSGRLLPAGRSPLFLAGLLRPTDAGGILLLGFAPSARQPRTSRTFAAGSGPGPTPGPSREFGGRGGGYTPV